MPATVHLAAACLALVLLTFVVGLVMLYSRMLEMRTKRVHPQATSTSLQMAAKLQDVRAADNFKNLFETPVLFYALAAMSIATGYSPVWIVAGSWLFVALRVAHSLIQCTYNKVKHRFAVFCSSFVLLVVLWVAFVVGLVGGNNAA